MKNVKVTYPDSTYSIRSLEDQIRSIESETLAFRTWFLWWLLYKQEAVPTKFGEYELTDEPIIEKK